MYFKGEVKRCKTGAVFSVYLYFNAKNPPQRDGFSACGRYALFREAVNKSIGISAANVAADHAAA